MARPPPLVMEPISSSGSPTSPIFLSSSSSSLPSTHKWKPIEFRCGVSGLRFGSATHPRISTSVRAIESSDRGEREKSLWISDHGEGEDSLDVPVFSASEVADRLREFRENAGRAQKSYAAMYSSVVGGITRDPASMVIPMDDHMVHRGHGVFDTAAIMDGCLYELDQHLDRFLRSASMARIPLPFGRAAVRSILIRTVSASGCTHGSLRYWLSAGPGNFLLSPSGCPGSALYAVVIQAPNLPEFEGVRVVTSSVPMKSPQFAVMKSVNYLPNVLSKMEAEENGAFAAIWLDDDGYVAEGPNMNVGFVTKGRELVVPRFEKILSGCTSKRVLVLAEKLVKEGKLSGISVRDVTVDEGKMAGEMMLVGSGIVVKPVLRWDDHAIGGGKEGPVSKLLFDLVVGDMKSGPSTVRVPVPY